MTTRSTSFVLTAADFRRLTHTPGNDAHSEWSPDRRVDRLQHVSSGVQGRVRAVVGQPTALRRDLRHASGRQRRSRPDRQRVGGGRRELDSVPEHVGQTPVKPATSELEERRTGMKRQLPLMPFSSPPQSWQRRSPRLHNTATTGAARPPATAHVDFGVLPVGPLGPPPVRSGKPGATRHRPRDRRSVGPLLIQAPHPHAGRNDDPQGRRGHVSDARGCPFDGISSRQHTTRDEIGQFLCPGEDPADSPDFHPCPTAGPVNAAARTCDLRRRWRRRHRCRAQRHHAHPDNRVWSTPGRLMSAGGHQVLNGGTIPAGADFQWPTGDASVPQDRPLPGDLHESFTLPERLDVRLRQRG